MFDIDIIIRHYEPGDLADCRQLWLVLTEWHRYIYESPGIGGDNPGQFFDEHLEQVGADNIWVAEVEGKVVGLTGLIIEGQEGELEPIVVMEDYQGRGIGQQLVKAVVEQAQRKGISQLKVRPVGRNEKAIQFFHKLGFTVIGHIELFREFQPEAEQRWQEKERIADRNFRV